MCTACVAQSQEVKMHPEFRSKLGLNADSSWLGGYR